MCGIRKQFWTAIFMTLCLCLSGLITDLSADDEPEGEELFDLPFEKLLDLTITTASKKAEKISDIPASVVIITRKNIKEYGFQTLYEIFDNVPGMYMIDEYNSIGVLNYGVRGFYAPGAFTNMAVLINGVRQLDDWNDTPGFHMDVPVEAIDRIEIVRGPMSVIYGTGAFFGAINIITDDRYNSYPIGIASVSVGNLNTYKAFSRFGGKIEKLSYSLYASYDSDDGIDEPYTKMMTDPSIATGSPPKPGSAYNRPFETTKGTLQYKNKQFSASTAYNGLTLDFRMFHREKGTRVLNPTDDPAGLHEQRTAICHLGYEKKMYDWLTIVLKGAYSHLSYEYNSDFFYKYFLWVNSISYDSYELEFNAIVKPVSELDMILGISRRTMEGYHYKHDVPEAWVPSLNNLHIFADPVTTHAAFIQMDWTPYDRFRMIGGIRFEKNEAYGYERIQVPNDAIREPVIIAQEYEPDKDFEIIPRVAMIYDLNDNNVIKFMYGSANKRPSVARVTENPSLNSEKIETYELNYIGSLSSKLIFNASVFHNKAKNLIAFGWNYNPSTGDFTLTSENVGELSTNGAEVGIQANLFKNLTLDMAVTYQNTVNERHGFNDIEPGYAPKWLGYIKAAYKFPKNITFAVTGRYMDDMKPDWDYVYGVDKETHLPVANPDDPKAGRLGYSIDDYFIFNTNLRIDKLFNTGFYLNANVSNLFDEDVNYPTTEAFRFADLGTLGYGRRFLVTLGYEW